MAWCPKCKQEYEDNVEICADCQVPLVESLEETLESRLLTTADNQEEANLLVEYLKYSGIESVSMQEVQGEELEVFQVLVNEKEWESARHFFIGYARDRAEKALEEEPIEEIQFNDYETIDPDEMIDLSDIKSSYQALMGIGGLVVIIGALNIFKILNFFSGMMLYVFTALGLAFFIGGIISRISYKHKSVEYYNLKDDLNLLYKKYVETYPESGFFDRHPIDVEGIEHGELYFIVMDKLVEECRAMSLSEDDLKINTVADRVYKSLIPESEEEAIAVLNEEWSQEDGSIDLEVDDEEIEDDSQENSEENSEEISDAKVLEETKAEISEEEADSSSSIEEGSNKDKTEIDK